MAVEGIARQMAALKTVSQAAGERRTDAAADARDRRAGRRMWACVRERREAGVTKV